MPSLTRGCDWIERHSSLANKLDSTIAPATLLETPADVFENRAPVLLQEGCRVFAHQNAKRRVAGGYTRNGRSIRNTEAVHTVDLQFTFD